jgi:hypothetical protein
MNHVISRGTQRASSSFSERTSLRTSRCWSSASRIWNPAADRLAPMHPQQPCAMPWNVPIQSGDDGVPSCASMRPAFSPAALFVNVTASTPCGETFSTCTSHATRCVSTRVLPLPAREHERRRERRRDGGTLCLVERSDEVGHIHGGRDSSNDGMFFRLPDRPDRINVRAAARP